MDRSRGDRCICGTDKPESLSGEWEGDFAFPLISDASERFNRAR